MNVIKNSQLPPSLANAKVHVKVHVRMSFRSVRKEKTLRNQGFILVKVVELGGIEPPSASPLQAVLHT